MPTSTQDGLARHIYAVQRYAASTAPRYAALAERELTTHPLSCFGNPADAIVVTVGLNPSLTEFKNGRPWPAILTHTELAGRSRNYFSPHAPCQPHAWFKPWSEGLACLDVSYQNGSAVHLDLSPRATRSVSAMKTAAQKTLFLKMVERDLWVFFTSLQLCQNAKLILMAGSVTGKYYMPEFLHSLAPDYGYNLDRPFHRSEHSGKGKTSWHRLSGLGRQIPVFFCSSSPADRPITILPQRLQENAPALKRLLAGASCSNLPLP